MKVSFITLGCKVNQYETQAIKEKISEMGYDAAKDGETPDICIINTCSVTNIADRKSRQAIRHIKKLNPDCIIAVTGCYAQTGAKQLKDMDEVDIIAGTNEKSRLPEMISEFIDSGKSSIRVRDYDELSGFDEMGTVEAMDGRTRAYIKIQEGCNRFCSYCIIPYARGNVRSRNEAVILEEAGNLINKGYREIVLTGINTALYGSESDGEPKLHMLIEKLSVIPGNFRIRLSSLEPTVINAEYVKKLFVFDKLCHHVHLSVQSGSDSILKSMNRRYNREEYMEIVETLKAFDPCYGISTDIIVGFPGESEEDFEDSVRITDEVDFCKVHVFRYSPRKNTPAAGMREQVASVEKNRRSAYLIRASESSSARFIEKNLGSVRPVLLEEYSPEQSLISGYTDNYIKVYVESNVGKKLPINTITDVFLKEVYLDGIKGEIIHKYSR